MFNPNTVISSINNDTVCPIFLQFRNIGNETFRFIHAP